MYVPNSIYLEIRTRQQPKLSTFPGTIRFIGDTVLNHKKDIKFHTAAETEAGAEKFAKMHNLVLGPEEDINGDDIPDVVLNDKKGQPVLINGYGVIPSMLRYRVKFGAKYAKQSAKTRIAACVMSLCACTFLC